MSNHQADRLPRWTELIALGAVIVLGILIFGMMRGNPATPTTPGAPVLQATTAPSPSPILNLAAIKATLEQSVVDTQAAAALTPTYPIKTSTPDLSPGATPDFGDIPHRNAGAGIIVEGPDPTFAHQDYAILNSWVETDFQRSVYVDAGGTGGPPNTIPDQGMILVIRNGDFNHPQQFLTPFQDGPMAIVDARGTRLFLSSYYHHLPYIFDVATGQPITPTTATLAAAIKTPLPEGTVWYFPQPTPTLMPEQLTPPQGTPAGNGQIFDNLPISWSKLIGFRPLTKWDKVVGDRDITVISGVGMNDTTQGWIHVSVFAYSPYQDLIEDGEYPAPSQTGGVRIVGVQGDRLILLSDTGATLYFDVPGRTFVGSLTEVVVTATPVPYTPAPTATPAFSDDAPNSPEDISQNSLVNTDLRYFINPSGDVDWFRFHTEVTSTLTVHLENLPADYSLDVFSATDPQVRGRSSQSGTADRLVTLTNAAPHDYYVEVAGVNGAWRATTPYTLRFDVPESSITSNFNGTAIAASNYIWFNSILKVSGLGSNSATLWFLGSNIYFTANGIPYNLSVPAAIVTFSSTATAATTTFVPAYNRWETTVPLSYSGNVFLSGLAYQVPGGGLPGGINPVTWSGQFASDTPGLTVDWKWAAAVYTQFRANSDDLGVKPIDGDQLNPYSNSDHAGTPENFKSFVIGGVRGGGGASNYTGSYSGTGHVTP